MVFIFYGMTLSIFISKDFRAVSAQFATSHNGGYVKLAIGQKWLF